MEELQRSELQTIHLKGLTKSYKKRKVVDDVSIEISQGDIIGLLGPNGAGKTTTFYMTVGLIQPDKGAIFMGETNITSLPMYRRARMGIGYLPQEASVFRKMSVEDNILAILELLPISQKARHERLEKLLDEFHLQHVRKSMGGVVSGGERRRTEIARVLAIRPKFILLDEPFAGIDPIAIEDIQQIIQNLKSRNIGILITDHNVQETLSICDKAYIMISGSVFRQGTAQELSQDPDVRRHYLGSQFRLKKVNRKKDTETTT